MKKILLISISFLLFRTVPTILSGRFTFAFDMGRDMLWVRNMVELNKPTLIGPWGSIAGVYFGPLWYYLLAIPYIFFNGDPRSAVVVPLLSNIATLLIGWWFLKRGKHPIAANIWAILFGFSPLVISTSGFAFHANLLPLATLLFLIGLSEYSNVSKHLPLWPLPLAALMASITFHLEPAAGLMLTLYLGIWVCWTIWRSRNEIRHSIIRLFVYSFIAFSLPFTPQMVFEFRHDFIQTKALMSYFRGENESLGGVLPLAERIPERVTKFARTLSQTVLPLDSDWQKWVLLGVFGILGILVIKQKNVDGFSSRFLLHASRFTLVHYLSYTFLFPAELKNWYLFGFASVFLLAIALTVEFFWKKQSVLVLLITAMWIWKTVNPLELFRSASMSPAAPETLRAQLEVVDYVYKDAKENGLPFSVYTYTPPIYDYTYQYLLWWRGTRRYGMLPAEFSYLPGETLYLPEKEKFVSRNWKPEDARVLYLVIEPDQVQDRYLGWRGHLSKFDKVSRGGTPRAIGLTSGVTIGVLYLSEYPKSESADTIEDDKRVNPPEEPTPSPTPDVEPDEKTLKILGTQVLSAIKSKEMEKLIPLMDKGKGVFFSVFYSGNGATLFASDFQNFFTDPTIHEWGTGASGFPTRMTKAEFYSEEVNGQPFNEPLYDQDYLNAPEVGVNRVVYNPGNSINIREFTEWYYEGRPVKFVEYFFPGTEEYAEHDFSVLSLVFEKVRGRFVLVGVFKDHWTP